MPESPPESKEAPQTPAPIEAVETPVPQKPDNKAADPLRWVTIAISLVAVVISGESACNSKRSADTARAALRLAAGQLDLAKQVRHDNLESSKRQQAENALVRQQSREALNAATAQSKASLEATIASSRADLRAWVGSTSFVLPTCLEHQTPVFIAAACNPTLGANITNTGRTVATDYVALVGAVLQSAELPFEPVYNLIAAPSRSVLFPGQHVSNYAAPFSRPFSAEAVDALKAGKLKVYLYGKLDYKDAFGGIHVTTFCYRIEPDLRSVGSCPFYNSAS